MNNPTRSPSSANSSVRIVTDGFGHRATATRRFLPGESVLSLVGVVVSRPSRYTLQIGPGQHLGPPAGLTADDHSPDYAWRFVNHSCRPNAEARGEFLFALGDILPGDDITLDYNATEDRLEEAFLCRCGHCGGKWILGQCAERGDSESGAGVLFGATL